jgi:hypothetical protein
MGAFIGDFVLKVEYWRDEPLTPALSPWEGERENRGQVSGEPGFMERGT